MGLPSIEERCTWPVRTVPSGGGGRIGHFLPELPAVNLPGQSGRLDGVNVTRNLSRGGIESGGLLHEPDEVVWIRFRHHTFGFYDQPVEQAHGERRCRIDSIATVAFDAVPSP